MLFLHGFLGQKEDWDLLFSHLPVSFPKQAIDLPGHGQRPMASDIAQSVHEKVPNAKVLVGYSAGGRLALELKERFPNSYERVIVHSADPGLTSEKEKKSRWEKDQQWIQMLQTEPFDLFLQKWYAQDLFKSLRKNCHFAEMLARRKKQDPKQLAQFLTQFSIARKNPSKIFPSTIFLYGEEDLKYEKQYRTLGPLVKVIKIPKASHAVHLENPKECARIITGAFDEQRCLATSEEVSGHQIS